MRELRTIIIHHSDSYHGNTNLIRKWHVDERGFDDVGYHYVICNGYETKEDFIDIKDGAVETARPIRMSGAHAYGQNRNSIGICLIGKDRFTTKQLSNLVLLVQQLSDRYNISRNNVLGHRELAGVTKSCPGFEVSDIRKQLRSR